MIIRAKEQLITPSQANDRYAGIPRVYVARARMLFILGAVFYIVLFQGAYIYCVAPSWSYLGYTYGRPPYSLWAAGTIAALMPAFWMPYSLVRPSQWLYLYLYLAAYVPGCLVPIFRGTALGQPSSYLLPMPAVLLCCMAVLGLIYRIPLIEIPQVRIRPVVFWAGILGFLAVAYSIVYFAFGSSLRLVGASAIAEHRLAGREVLAYAAVPAALVSYSVTFLGNVINPLLMSVGLWSRRPIAFLLGAIGQLFFYAANAARGPLSTIPLLLLLYFSVRQRRIQFGNFWMWGMACASLVGILSIYVPSEWLQNIVSWALLRTLVVPGQLIGVYHDFFSTNAQTLFSHISGLGWIIANPYQGQSLGFVIGASMGRPDDQENANLWADGFASYGYLGMVIVSVLLAALLHLFDSSARKIDCRLACLAIGVQGLILTNLSVFTSFLGAGFGFAALLIYLMPNGRALNAA